MTVLFMVASRCSGVPSGPLLEPCKVRYKLQKIPKFYSFFFFFSGFLWDLVPHTDTYIHHWAGFHTTQGSGKQFPCGRGLHRQRKGFWVFIFFEKLEIV